MRANEFINEVNMSPSALKKRTSGINAHAGMEFEMYIPGVTLPSNTKTSRNYPGDRQVRSISEIFDFYEIREGSDFYEYFMDNFEQWKANRRDRYWSSDKKTVLFDKYLDKMYSPDEKKKILQNWTQQKLARKNMNEYINENPDFVDAVARQYRKEYNYNLNDLEIEHEMLEDIGITMMSDMLTEFPNSGIYWSNGANDKNSGMTLSQLAGVIKKVVNTNVIPSEKYHGVERDNSSYIVEPDSSLKAVEDLKDAGVEIISPPLPLKTMLQHLGEIIQWAKGYGCYTGPSCGLHMNVSLDDVPIENLDYVKLALFVGDEYILREYNRLGNSYAKSSVSIIKRNSSPVAAIKAMEEMKTGLTKLAHKVIHSGVTQHEMSLNVHQGYVEFRHAGGDWLNIEYDKLQNTLLRFVSALDIACDPTKYQQEYAKKLYKLLNTGEDGIMQQFVEYSIGLISRNEMIANIKGLQQKREKVRQNYHNYLVTLSNESSQIISFMFDVYDQDTKFFAKNAQDAIQQARTKWGQRYQKLPDSDFIVQELD